MPVTKRMHLSAQSNRTIGSPGIPGYVVLLKAPGGIKLIPLRPARRQEFVEHTAEWTWLSFETTTISSAGRSWRRVLAAVMPAAPALIRHIS